MKASDFTERRLRKMAQSYKFNDEEALENYNSDVSKWNKSIEKAKDKGSFHSFKRLNEPFYRNAPGGFSGVVNRTQKFRNKNPDSKFNYGQSYDRESLTRPHPVVGSEKLQKNLEDWKQRQKQTRQKIENLSDEKKRKLMRGESVDTDFGSQGDVNSGRNSIAQYLPDKGLIKVPSSYMSNSKNWLNNPDQYNRVSEEVHHARDVGSPRRRFENLPTRDRRNYSYNKIHSDSGLPEPMPVSKEVEDSEKVNYARDPREFKSDMGHIRQFYTHRTGNAVSDEDDAMKALDWFMNQDPSRDERIDKGVQDHMRLLKEHSPEFEEWVKGVMPRTVQNNRGRNNQRQNRISRTAGETNIQKAAREILYPTYKQS